MEDKFKELSCPSCGAPLEVKNRFVKVIVCEYCGQSVKLTEEGATPEGKAAKLFDYPSILKKGATGKILNKNFTALGRVRYKHSSGFWDEWFIEFEDGTIAWLTEEEGEYTLLSKKKIKEPMPAYEDIRAGAYIPLSAGQLYVYEKGEAVIIGSEGQLSYVPKVNSKIKYIDGSLNKKDVSIEIGSDEVELYEGEELEREEIKVD